MVSDNESIGDSTKPMTRKKSIFSRGATKIKTFGKSLGRRRSKSEKEPATKSKLDPFEKAENGTEKEGPISKEIHKSNRMLVPYTDSDYRRRFKLAPAIVDLIDEEPVSKSPIGFKRVFKMRTPQELSAAKADGPVKAVSSGDIGLPTVVLDEAKMNQLEVIRSNLPPDKSFRTPFGMRRICYADYTASGRAQLSIEEYIRSVVNPLFANTHTETSVTGLQTTHFREEAREIVMESCGANKNDHCLVFHGTGVTGAISKFINMLGLVVPYQLRELIAEFDLEEPPLVFISDSEHHSNELMWRENMCEVVVIGRDKTGKLDAEELRDKLEAEKIRQNLYSDMVKGVKPRLVIGSFTAGSNVTGLRTNPHVIAQLLHEYSALSAWDYAAAGPYVDINMAGDPDIPNSYLDAIYLSPHKFVGGPGTPGVLIARKDCFKITQDMPPSIAGGGTVAMVWRGGNVIYEKSFEAREEAGTPDIIGAIRCGLVFRLRSLIGPKTIEALEGDYARRAVEILRNLGNVWIMGDDRTDIMTSERLSITSFNIMFKITDEMGDIQDKEYYENKMLHPHFVCALLNDLYGIQARSGCSCAGPLGMDLFDPAIGNGYEEATAKFAAEGYHAQKPGWCRVNFNYFIEEDEFQFLINAIEQIAKFGWKLLPLYASCIRTGQYFYNDNISRFDNVRLLKEFNFSSDNKNLEWHETPDSTLSYSETLKQAMEIYDTAPDRVRRILYRYRDFRRNDQYYPSEQQKFRFFLVGHEMLPLLGIDDSELDAGKADPRHNDADQNPRIVQYPKHHTANPWFTFGRPRG